MRRTKRNVRKMGLGFCAVAVLIALLAVGCGGKPGAGASQPESDPGRAGNGESKASEGVSVGNGFHLQMLADLSDAVALTTTVPGTKAGSERLLYKVTGTKELQKVMAGPHDIHHWKETPTHIIAQVYLEEGDQKCFLIAIPKVRGKTPVLCLSREPLLTPGSNATYATRPLRPHFDVQGSEVFFAHEVIEKSTRHADAENVVSELRHWDGRSEKVQTVFHGDMDFNRMPPIEQVFASETNTNVCFSLMSSYYNRASEPTRAHLFCRASAEAAWRKMPGLTVDDRSIKFANSILLDGSWNTSGKKFRLADLTLAERTGPVPTTRDYDLAEGGFIGRGTELTVNGTISCVDRDGNGRKLAEVNTATDLVRIGGWAWFFGSQTLRRVDLKDCTLDRREYFDDTSLIQLSRMGWVLGDFLRLDGTNGRGQPSTVHLTTGGTLIDMRSQDVTVDHPIDLKWER